MADYVDDPLGQSQSRFTRRGPVLGSRGQRLARLCVKKKLPPPARLADAVNLVAIIGGYLARRKDPPPGHQLMWLGYSYLQRMCEGYLLRDEFAGLE